MEKIEKLTAERVFKDQIIKDGYTEADYERHFKYGKHTSLRAMEEYADKRVDHYRVIAGELAEVLKALKATDTKAALQQIEKLAEFNKHDVNVISKLKAEVKELKQAHDNSLSRYSEIKDGREKEINQ